MPVKQAKGRKTRYPGITRIGEDRFHVRVRWTDPRTGKRKKLEAVVESTEIDDALAKRAELKAERGEAQTPVTRQRFASFAKSWLKDHSRRQGLAPSTEARYIIAVGQLCEEWGDWWIDMIDKASIEAWQLNSAEGRSNQTVNGWHQILRLILDKAEDADLIQKNFARRVPTLRQGKTKGARGNSLSLAQFRRFMETTRSMSGGAIAADVARQILLIAWTGMRMGESLALRFDDVDAEEIAIERSVWGRREKATKTDDPRRVTIIQPVREIITSQRKWLLEAQHPGLGSGLVFPAQPSRARAGMTRRGSEDISWYRGHSVLKKPLELIAGQADIPVISPHSLRRTFEDLLREAGVDKLVRRAVAGWRTETAQAIYATVKQEERQAAAEAVLQLVMGEG
jgi:integrase